MIEESRPTDKTYAGRKAWRKLNGRAT
jgi:hypothetical protein